MGGVPVETIISFLMFFVNLFVKDSLRRQTIEDNMQLWFKKKTGRGEEINDGMTDLERQEIELRKTRGGKNGPPNN